MKKLLIILLLYVPLPDGFSNSIDSFDDNFYYKNNLLTKDEIIQKTNLGTKFIISEIEFEIYKRDKGFRTVK